MRSAAGGPARGGGGAAVGRVTVAALAAAVLVRLLRSPRHPYLIGAQAVARWALIPAVALVGLALRVRRWWLVLGGAGSAVVLTRWWRQAWGGGHRPVPAPHAERLALVTANVLLDNGEVAGLAADLARADADVLCLQEITPTHLDTLLASPLAATYPHRVVDARNGYHGSAVFSRLPMTGTVIDVDGSPMLDVCVHTAAGPVRLINVHTVAPLEDAMVASWTAQFGSLRELVIASTGPLILAGDFNATQDHQPLRSLLEAGLRDAHSEVGTGLGATYPQWHSRRWPRWRHRVPALMRLDHVLLGGGLRALDLQVQGNRGSDHRRLAATVELPAS